MSNIKTNTQFIEEDRGLMIRVDKTLKELTEEQPSSRWDVHYWDPKWEVLDDIVLPLIKFSQLMEDDGITYGQVGQRQFVDKGEVRYLQVINIRKTGIDYFIKEAFIKRGSRNDPKRSRLKPKQILLTRTSFPEMDTLIGRCVVVPENIGEVNVSEDIDVITLKKDVLPTCVCIFLKCKYGQAQIHRMKKGVKSIKINFDEIRSIKIPVFPQNVSDQISKEYKEIEHIHQLAMDFFQNNNKQSYSEMIKRSEEKIDSLLRRTEQVLRGEIKEI